MKIEIPNWREPCDFFSCTENNIVIMGKSGGQRNTQNSSKKPEKSSSKADENTDPNRTKKNSGHDSEHSYSLPKEQQCCSCDSLLSDRDAGIQCEVCNYWYCIDCSGMTPAFYGELVTSDLNENIIWYCNGCKRAIPGVKQVLKMVSSIKETQDKIEERLRRLEDKADEGPDTSESELSLEYKIDQAMMDFREREHRKRNVIVYNVPEASSESSEDRKSEDKVKIQEFCRKMEVAVNIESHTRLGEKKGDKPRPIKVEFQDENEKWNFVKKSSKLKESSNFSKVSITPDYTFRQRKMNNQMKEEVAKRRTVDPGFNFKKLKDELYGKSQVSPLNHSNFTRSSSVPESLPDRHSNSSNSNIPFRSSASEHMESQKNVGRGRAVVNVRPPPKVSPQYAGRGHGTSGRGAPLGRGSRGPPPM